MACDRCPIRRPHSRSCRRASAAIGEWVDAVRTGVTDTAAMTMVRGIRLALGAIVLLVAGCGPASGAPSVPPGTSASAPASPAGTAVAQSGIQGTATAGPVCPVEKVPPDPACAPRPVVGAVIVVRAAGGAEVARVQTGADGGYHADLPPGIYDVVPQPAEGVLGTAPAQRVTIGAGVLTLDLAYDTGIR